MPVALEFGATDSSAELLVNVAPLRPAEDAIHIVTDGNRFEDTVGAVVAAIRTAEERASVATSGRS